MQIAGPDECTAIFRPKMSARGASVVGGNKFLYEKLDDEQSFGPAREMPRRAGLNYTWS
jgi:hypothetical protein